MNRWRTRLVGQSGARRNQWVARFGLLLALVLVLPAQSYASGLGSSAAAGSGDVNQGSASIAAALDPVTQPPGLSHRWYRL
jgi:hypothetical protein